ncbi:glycosyltransferase family 50 protein [Abortiporus biennis]|nr:glycosyltransferase family 50 protein [Abortiporus biennis]
MVHWLSTRLSRTFSSFRNVLIISTIIRVALILYSEWHDAHSTVKYTDVDYRVFSDATRFILHPTPQNTANGLVGKWLGIGDPYTRATYRYTPLLALLLAPNEWIHPSFGKYLFAGCDIIAGIIMYNLLVYIILPSIHLSSSVSQNISNEVKSQEDTDAEKGSAITRKATYLVSLHLLNPMVFSISTRGSSESVLSLFVLATLYCALKSNWTLAAILLGLSTHWKIYPFIYGIACLGVIGSERGIGKGLKGRLNALVNARTIKFALISAGTFGLLNVLMYAIWGYPFLYESYLYHIHRRDHRHNFSPYFYLIYLTYPFPGDSTPQLEVWQQIVRSPLTSFIPQMALSLGAGILFGWKKKDLPFTWFIQTFAFVIFNRVCTSQYFLWYTLFVPLIIPRLSMPFWKALLSVAVWFGAQGLWLSKAYRLEFLGENVFYGLWLRGLIYVAGHSWVLASVMDSYQG